ncbi:MAG: electron transport complex subunit RsxC [Deltaproteobacteria bacterium]|nr:electron transport complex subunit RsxC [Deltaproteobacteria bacterium]
MSAETLATFPMGGVHPREAKELTEKLAVEVMPAPSEVRLFLKQHVGAPCEPVVNKKDKVTEGDLVASTEKLGAPLHAPVSGTVKGIQNALHPMVGNAPSLVIATDPEAEPRTYSPSDWTRLSKDELLAKIKEAGIVGMGGAGFPAGVKLSVRPDVKLDTLILNGAECEPYLTSDHRLMVEHAKEVVEGAKIILKVLGINYCAIGVENNKPEAIAKLRDAIAQDTGKNGYNVVVKPLKVKYPQGSADQIMQSVTGRARPSGVRSSAIGIIVQNVYTTKAIYDAVVLGKPLYERIVTFTGKGLKKPANLMVRVGTSISDVVDYLGGTTPDLAKVVVGGPMMGFSVSTLDIPITKTTSGVLFLAKDEIDTTPYYPCIRCGFCVGVCPMGLEPNNVSVYVEAGRGEDTEQFGVDDCFECGSCAYVCPAKRPLVQFMRLAKASIAAKKRK